jgi:hypothetical protein
MPEIGSTLKKMTGTKMSEATAIPKYLVALDVLLIRAILAFASFDLHMLSLDYKLDGLRIVQELKYRLWNAHLAAFLVVVMDMHSKLLCILAPFRHNE